MNNNILLVPVLLLIMIFLICMWYPKKNSNYVLIQSDELRHNPSFDIETLSQKEKYPNSLEFIFQNKSLNKLDIYYEKSQQDTDLIFITELPAESVVFVYPKNLKTFQPEQILYATFSNDESNNKLFAYKPYVMKPLDKHFVFGEISTDHLYTTNTYSENPNEILSLVFENRCLHPYDIWYRGDYIGRVGGYHINKKPIEYRLHSRNNDKHFQTNTWLEFKMVGDNKSQFIMLINSNITNINIGDIEGY